MLFSGLKCIEFYVENQIKMEDEDYTTKTKSNPLYLAFSTK